MNRVNELDILLAPGVFPPDSGGPATFAPDIGRALVARGHDVRTVTNGTAPAGFDTNYPFDVVRIPREGSIPRRYWRQIQTIVGEIREFEPDIVLVNAFDLQAVTAARLTRTPVITKVVGDNAWERTRRGGLTDDIETFQQRSYGPKVEALKLLRTLQTRAAHHVVVPSEYLRGIVETWGVPDDNLSVIYNSLDLDTRHVPDAERADRIVTVGRLVPWKGFSGLITAFSNMERDAEFHIVGDGPERDTLERHARASGREGDIVFHGRVEHERVLELLAHSKVFALNSTYEGLPHVVLEALACGTPVVASAAGGTPEAVIDGESGYLVQQGDTDAFTERFDRLIEDSALREQLRQGGFELLETRFDPESMIEAYERLLREVATR